MPAKPIYSLSAKGVRFVSGYLRLMLCGEEINFLARSVGGFKKEKQGFV